MSGPREFKIIPEQSDVEALERDLRFHPSPVTSPETLRSEQVEAFNREGFLTPLAIFNDGEVAGHRRYFDALLEKTLAAGGDSYSISSAHLKHGRVHDLLTHPRIVNRVKDLLGDNVIAFGSHFFCKMPGDGKAVAWHQDASYWPLTPSKTVTVWLAIDDSDVGNGCMRVIKGSHKTQLMHTEEPDNPHNILFRREKVAEAVAETDAVDLVLQPGEMSIHDYGVVHGSNPNDSDDRRIGFAITFVSADTMPRGRRETGMLVRGRARNDGWELEPRPKADLDAAARAAHKKAMEIRGGYFFSDAGKERVLAGAAE